MTPSQKAGQGRLRSLLLQLGLNSRKINRLHSEAAEMRVRGALKPSLFGKLTKWVEQIAGLERKELDLISEIDAIERQHRQLRKEQKLRHAAPPKELPPELDHPETPGKNNMWVLALLAMAFAPSRKKKNEMPGNG